MGITRLENMLFGNRLWALLQGCDIRICKMGVGVFTVADWKLLKVESLKLSHQSCCFGLVCGFDFILHSAATFSL